MSPDNLTDEIVRKARRLMELGPLIFRAVIEWQTDDCARYFSEFADTKNQLRGLFVEQPLVHLPGSADADVRRVLKTIAADELLPVEKALSGGPLKKALPAPLTEDDFEELGRESLYSWMSHVEYAEGLYRAGVLVVACGEIPKNLERFTAEARQCYAYSTIQRRLRSLPHDARNRGERYRERLRRNPTRCRKVRTSCGT